jgi:peroxiredoxin
MFINSNRAKANMALTNLLKLVGLFLIGFIIIYCSYILLQSKRKFDVSSGPVSDIVANHYSNSELLGKKIPYFKLRDVDGVKYWTNDQVVGKSLIIFIRSSDCADCLQESKYWQILYQRTSGTRVLGVVEEQNLHALQRLRSTYYLTFPILNDQNGLLFHELNITHTPVKVLIDEKRVIRKLDSTVYVEEEDFFKFVESID